MRARANAAGGWRRRIEEKEEEEEEEEEEGGAVGRCRKRVLRSIWDAQTRKAAEEEEEEKEEEEEEGGAVGRCRKQPIQVKRDFKEGCWYGGPPARSEAGRAAKGHQTTREGKQFTRKHESQQPDNCHAGPRQRTQRDIEKKRETSWAGWAG